MDDDKIKDLFGNFDPELSSDSLFMSRLQRNMDRVEFVHRHNAEQRSRNKKAVAIAAFIGFLIGSLFSLTLPYLGDALESMHLERPDSQFISFMSQYYLTLGLLIVGATSVFAAVNAYDLSLFLLRPKDTTD